MAAPTFTYDAWQGSGGLKGKSKVRKVKLGDAYEQRSQMGLVPKTDEYSFRRPDDSRANIDAMIAFLDALGPEVRPFYWTRPFGTPELWIQEGDYAVTDEKASSATFSVKFVRFHGAEE